MHEERRKHRRYELDCRAELSATPSISLRGRTSNLSDGGMLIAVDAPVLPLAVGQECMVHLSLPRQTANTRMVESRTCPARVCRRSETAGRAMLALQFLAPQDFLIEV